jgi:hypothetical protein
MEEAGIKVLEILERLDKGSIDPQILQKRIAYDIN